MTMLEYYIREGRSGNTDYAFHRLRSMDRRFLPALREAFRTESDPDIRALMIRALNERREDPSVDLLFEALSDTEPDVWKVALDGLVIFESPEVSRLLESAAGREEDPERLAWIMEAIDQVREAIDTGVQRMDGGSRPAPVRHEPRMQPGPLAARAIRVHRPQGDGRWEATHGLISRAVYGILIATLHVAEVLQAGILLLLTAGKMYSILGSPPHAAFDSSLGWVESVFCIAGVIGTMILTVRLNRKLKELSSDEPGASVWGPTAPLWDREMDGNLGLYP